MHELDPLVGVIERTFIFENYRFKKRKKELLILLCKVGK